jgi:cation diffusion facilitator CzcD-associated flavoprotein CzcO
MIGTGPSTAQIAPQIQPIVKHLTLFQRSPTYVLPRRDEPIPRSWILLFTWFPPVLWMYHLLLYFRKEKTKPSSFSGTPEQARATAAALGHLHRQVEDPILRAKLTPHHEFGCKRPLILDDYYPIFEKPNVELITNKPVRITEDSIISKPPAALPKEVIEVEPAGAYDEANLANENEHHTKCDVLIWGTGT